jgi:hypothetical protein
MSYSSEEIDNGQLAMMDDLETVRDDPVGELQAVNQCHEHIPALENEVVTTLEHIVGEE